MQTNNKHLDIDKFLLKKRGYVSKWPKSKCIVMIVSGGLDSIVTSARLIEDYGLELFPLHIHRGQTNTGAENKSVDYFTEYFQKKYGESKFHTPMKISVNVPSIEFKQDLAPYTKEKGHPMRDPIMQLLGVQYAVAASQKYSKDIRTVYCAIVPEDYFPHSTLQGLRVNTLNVCINTGDWEWQVSSPNIDPLLSSELFGKDQEIKWAMEHEISIGETISCNNASEKTNYLACGNCTSCSRRSEAFSKAGFSDPTKYYDK